MVRKVSIRKQRLCMRVRAKYATSPNNAIAKKEWPLGKLPSCMISETFTRSAVGRGRSTSILTTAPSKLLIPAPIIIMASRFPYFQKNKRLRATTITADRQFAVKFETHSMTDSNVLLWID